MRELMPFILDPSWQHHHHILSYDTTKLQTLLGIKKKNEFRAAFLFRLFDYISYLTY